MSSVAVAVQNLLRICIDPRPLNTALKRERERERERGETGGRERDRGRDGEGGRDRDRKGGRGREGGREGGRGRGERERERGREGGSERERVRQTDRRTNRKKDRDRKRQRPATGYRRHTPRALQSQSILLCGPEVWLLALCSRPGVQCTHYIGNPVRKIQIVSSTIWLIHLFIYISETSTAGCRKPGWGSLYCRWHSGIWSREQ